MFKNQSRKNNASIIVFAYTALNLGDDLFLKILFERYKSTGVLFLLTGPRKYHAPFRHYKNVKSIIHIPFIDEALRRLGVKFSINTVIINYYNKKAKATVHIGGSLFIQKAIGKIEPENYSKKINKNHFILGANFGPYKDQNFYEGFAKIFQSVNDVSFREKYSHDLFNSPNIRSNPDIVFNLYGQKDIYNENPFNDLDKYTVVSLIDLKNHLLLKKYFNSYNDAVLKMCLERLKLDEDIIFVSFCSRQNDYKINKLLSDFIPMEHKQRIHFYNYTGNIDEVLSIYKDAQFSIATRFHAFIISVIMHIPVLPIIYSEKTFNVIEDMNFKGKYFYVKDLNSNLIDTKLIEEISNYKYNNLTSQFQKSNNHFSILDKFISNFK